MDKAVLKPGDIMQLSPTEAKNKAFSACLFIVTEPKEFGAKGYVQALGGDPNTIGGQAYYRATWAEMEPTGGRAEWLAV